MKPVNRASVRCAAVMAVMVAAAGCNQYQKFDSVDHLRQHYAQHVGPDAAAALVVPFEPTPEMKARVEFAHKQPSELRRLNQVLDVIFQQLDLRYQLAPTRSAVQTWQSQQGNCLSFVNLFVALARESRLNPFYVEVTDYERWSHRAGMVVSQGHIVAGMYLDGELKTYDFLPYRPKAYKDFLPIDDVRAAAHFYNNLGAEALFAGDLDEAERLITIATKVAPDFEKAINNLGVVRARRGDYSGALAAYERALAIDPDNHLVMTNLARLHQRAGRNQEADAMLSAVESGNTTNPYFFVYQADLALSRGDTARALDAMVKALRLDVENPDVHVGLVKVYLALGDTEKARHHLDRALKLDATNDEARRYAQMLGG